ncbi:MAG: hypothetical protein SH850_30330 [Planctomycetaceae bacterium]|nr:hypothetical protein [Planctomycetaceae bacterium]
MLRQGTTWLACIAVGLVSLTVAPDDADASWRRARRWGNNGYNQGGYYQNAGGYNGRQNGGACCGAVQQTATYQQPIYQQATYQPAGNACSVQQSGYQTNHTSGYAPQGQVHQPGQYHQGGIQTGTRQPPPPPVESDDAPRTFQEAPEPKDSDRSEKE